MTAARSRPALHKAEGDSTAAVEAFMRALDHPRKPELNAIRRAILGASPSIAEGIKWNAPSFRTTEYFATTNLRQKDGIAVVLHLGAKARTLPPGGLTVDDPAAMLKWLGKDRAMVVFASLQDFEAKRPDFVRIVRQWIAFV